MTPFPAGTCALVHGLGRFGGGREAVRFLARHGVRVRIAD
jgi:UDP-N-acetylmuramoylalanine-D-glutamate ligase